MLFSRHPSRVRGRTCLTEVEDLEISAAGEFRRSPDYKNGGILAQDLLLQDANDSCRALILVDVRC